MRRGEGRVSGWVCLFAPFGFAARPPRAWEPALCSSGRLCSEGDLCSGSSTLRSVALGVLERRRRRRRRSCPHLPGRKGGSAGVPTNRGRQRDWLSPGSCAGGDAPGSPPCPPPRLPPPIRLSQAWGWNPAGTAQKTFPLLASAPFCLPGRRRRRRRLSCERPTPPARPDAARPMAAPGDPAARGGRSQRRAPGPQPARVPPAQR